MYKELILALRDAAPQVGKEYCSPFGDLMDSSADALEQMVASSESWRKNHDNQVRCAKALKDRLDLPYERTMAYKLWREDVAAVEALVLERRELRAEIERLRLLLEVANIKSENC